MSNQRQTDYGIMTQKQPLLKQGRETLALEDGKDQSLY